MVGIAKENLMPAKFSEYCFGNASKVQVHEINHSFNCSAAQNRCLYGLCDSRTCTQPRRAHFFIADEYPQDTTIAQLGKKMFLQVQNPTGVQFFTGGYYKACKQFAD